MVLRLSRKLVPSLALQRLGMGSLVSEQLVLGPVVLPSPLLMVQRLVLGSVVS